MTHPAPAPRLAVPVRLDPAALTGFDAAAEVVGLAGVTMGTTWRVRLALSAGRSLTGLEDQIQQRLDRIVGEMSHWDPSSHLCAFNAAPSGSWVALPDDFRQVMIAALRIAEQSAGAFDPAIGRLTDLWGLGPRQVVGEPSMTDLAAALTQSNWARIALDAEAGQLLQPGGLWLDLSGIAKGYAADAVATILSEAGVHHALVEVGGECVGRGIRPDGDPWWVDIETPQYHPAAPLRVALHQLAIATSGDYLRGLHALDPQSGHPALSETTAVTVVHETCMEADAWATALSAVPLPQAKHMAERFGLSARLLARDGKEWVSPALCRMLQ